MNSSSLLALRRRAILLAIVPLVVGLIVFVTTPASDDAVAYRSSVVVLFTPDPRSSGNASSRVSQAALLVPRADVGAIAASNYGDEYSRRFAQRIRYVIDDKALTIELSADGIDPDEVSRYVKAYADALVAVTAVRANTGRLADLISYETEVERLEREYNDFIVANEMAIAANDREIVDQRQALLRELNNSRNRYIQVQREASAAPTEFEALQASPAAEVPPGTLEFLGNPVVRGLLAMVLTLVGLIGLVIAVERISPRVSDRDHVEEIAGVPVLAMVPYVRTRKQYLDRLDPDEFTGPLAEAYRALRVHLQFLATEASNGNGSAPATTAVAVVSSAPGEGKTTTAAMLAMAYAEVETSTLVLGCDFRRPTVHERFGVPQSPGFTDRHLDSPQVAPSDLIHRDPITGIRMLPSGPPTSRFHQTGDVEAVMRAAKAVGQQVVIDTAPLLVASESSEIASLADHVVVVVRAGHTSVRALREAITTMRLNQINCVGVVMIGSPEAADYTYYYTQYRRDQDSRSARAEDPVLAPLPAEGVRR